MSNELSDCFKSDYENGTSIEHLSGLQRKCELCDNKLSEPVMLSCLHVFDKNCLLAMESQRINLNQMNCPKCDITSSLSNFKILKNYCSLSETHSQFLNDDTKNNNDNHSNDEFNKCILCTSGELAIYKCPECAGIICERCFNLHKEVVIFQTHTNVQELSQQDKDNLQDTVKSLYDNKPIKCSTHKEEKLEAFCYNCYISLCSKCITNSDHKNHNILSLNQLLSNMKPQLSNLINKCRQSQSMINQEVEQLTCSLEDVTKSRDLNKTRIEEACEFWKAAIDQIKDEMILVNKNLHDGLEYKHMSQINQDQKRSDHIDHAIEFINGYIIKCPINEASNLLKPSIDCLEMLSQSYSPLNSIEQTNIPIHMPSYDDIRTIIRANFASFSHTDPINNINMMMNNGTSGSNSLQTTRSLNTRNSITSNNHSDPPVDLFSPNYDDPELLAATLNSTNNSNTSPVCDSNNVFYKPSPPSVCGNSQNLAGSHHSRTIINNNHSFPTLENLVMSSPGPIQNSSSIVTQQLSSDYFSYPSNNEMSPLISSKGSLDMVHSYFDAPHIDSPTTSCVTGNMGTPFSHSSHMQNHHNQMGAVVGGGSIQTNMMGQPIMGQNSSNHRPALINLNPVPKPPFPRNRNYNPMVIKERWGCQGSSRGQLNSPHGFCLGFSEEIVVADTQNHRIQIFSKDGQFLSQFGIAGREEGHLWHPRKVTIIRNTQHYVVCDRGSERSRMQIFAKNGYFIRKIAIPYIDIVAGLAINNQGHIVAVDSVSPTIFVVTESGEMVKWIECSSQMREPSDIVVHGDNYYICDFKGHCVCVYKQDGTFLYRFGNEKITNYPNGIDVSDLGDILVGDSHGNRFHVAVFSKDGQLTGEFECPSVKVSRACGLKITSEGYLVTLAKNNHNVLVIDTLYVN